MVSIKEILQGLKDKALTVCSKVYTQERPTATDDGLASFIVVSVPTSLYEEIEGMSIGWWTHTAVQFEIYTKDKATAANPNQMNIPKSDSMFCDIMNLFPFTIQGQDVVYNVKSPEVLLVGRSDGNGFHFTLIQATLTTI